MENATDALKMAFAMMMFVICLSIAFSMISKAKETADTILWYSDKTNYMEGPLEEEESLKDGRTVGRDVVISTLYQSVKNGTPNVRIILRNGTTIDFPKTGTDIKIEEVIEELGANAVFKENVQEVTIAGSYKIAEDGTKIVVSREGSSNPVKVYVTYTQQ